MMTGIYLLLGSNLGSKEQNLNHARKLIERTLGPVILSSSIYITEAWGMDKTPVFLNQALMINSSLQPVELLEEILNIEILMGRVRTAGYQDRTIDIDILYYGDLVVMHSDLIIPHPRIQERRFALQPMTEIAPNFIHPTLGKTHRQLLDSCTDKLSVNIHTP